MKNEWKTKQNNKTGKLCYSLVNGSICCDFQRKKSPKLLKRTWFISAVFRLATVELQLTSVIKYKQCNPISRARTEDKTPDPDLLYTTQKSGHSKKEENIRSNLHI